MLTDGLLVVEDDGRRLRVARVERDEAGRPRVVATSSRKDAAMALLDSTPLRGTGAPPPVIVITPRARPLAGFLSGAEAERLALASGDAGALEEVFGARVEGCGMRVWGWEADLFPADEAERPFVAAAVDLELARRWLERLEARGLRLAGIYPQLGAPLAALEPRLYECPTLALQVESDEVAVIELIGGRCSSIEVHRRDHPTTGMCAALIGVECPEVLLCGGDEQLPQLGYELARRTGTWVRLQRERGASNDTAPPPPMAILGAAYHALDLAPAGRVACIPVAA